MTADEKRIEEYVREQNAKSEGLIKEAVDGWYAEGPGYVKIYGKGKKGREKTPSEGGKKCPRIMKTSWST